MLHLSAASAYLYHGDIDMRKGSTAWIKNIYDLPRFMKSA